MRIKTGLNGLLKCPKLKLNGKVLKIFAFALHM